MAATLRATVSTTLPADDEHPYRSGAWRPQHREWDADDLDVEGELPADLSGVYLRNTENPVHPSIGRYHPFDGDGMLHQIAFHDGQASYRNRFVRTDGFLAEQDAAESLWTGMLGAPEQSKRDDGWGARGRMKDASSTDVVVHNGQALTSFWQCGDLYALDPRTLEHQGKAGWAAGFPSPDGHLRPPQARRAHRGAARLRLRQGVALPASGRRQRGRRAAAVDRRRAPGPAAAARHGLHRAVRHPQRPAALLGP